MGCLFTAILSWQLAALCETLLASTDQHVQTQPGRRFRGTAETAKDVLTNAYQICLRCLMPDRRQPSYGLQVHKFNGETAEQRADQYLVD